MVSQDRKCTYVCVDSVDRADDREETARVQAGQLWPPLPQPLETSHGGFSRWFPCTARAIMIF